MKSKKGFTLIELLAIIVILAIIAVITVPIILNIIDNSKKGTALDSAYGYKNAIQNFYAAKLIENSNYVIPNDTYTVETLKELGISVEGNEPEGDSWISIKKNKIMKGCLQFKDYKISISDGEFENVEKGQCEFLLPTFTDKDNNGTISLGDQIKIGNEEFWIVDTPSDGKVKIITRGCLGYENGTVFQYAGSCGLSGVNFSNTNYWYDRQNSRIYDIYPKDTHNQPYVYTRDTQNNIYEWIEAYKTYLKEQGVTYILDARLMTYEEALKTGCATYKQDSCPKFMTTPGFWLGNAVNGNTSNDLWGIFPIRKDIEAISINDWRFFQKVRPLIEIPESAISI